MGMASDRSRPARSMIASAQRTGSLERKVNAVVPMWRGASGRRRLRRRGPSGSAALDGAARIPRVAPADGDPVAAGMRGTAVGHAAIPGSGLASLDPSLLAFLAQPLQYAGARSGDRPGGAGGCATL